MIRNFQINSAHFVKGDVSVGFWNNANGRAQASLTVNVNQITTREHSISSENCDEETRKTFVYSHCLKNWDDNVVSEGLRASPFVMSKGKC
ncbi:unnamed protein product [Rhizopus microsporus]